MTLTKITLNWPKRICLLIGERSYLEILLSDISFSLIYLSQRANIDQYDTGSLSDLEVLTIYELFLLVIQRIEPFR